MLLDLSAYNLQRTQWLYWTWAVVNMFFLYGNLSFYAIHCLFNLPTRIYNHYGCDRRARHLEINMDGMNALGDITGLQLTLCARSHDAVNKKSIIITVTCSETLLKPKAISQVNSRMVWLYRELVSIIVDQVAFSNQTIWPLLLRWRQTRWPTVLLRNWSREGPARTRRWAESQRWRRSPLRIPWRLSRGRGLLSACCFRSWSVRMRARTKAFDYKLSYSVVKRFRP